MKAMLNHDVDVDFIKIGYFDPFMKVHDEVAMIRPLLIHGFGHYECIGMREPEKLDWDDMNHILHKYKVPHLGVHFAIYDKDIRDISQIRERLEQGIKIFKERLDVPLIIENIDYNPMYKDGTVLAEAVNPAFISHVCNEYNVDMLLDTAHAKVSAYHTNTHILDYLGQLPLERVKEIHFVGTKMTEEYGIKDTHTELEDSDYVLMSTLLESCKPDIITLEYGWPGDEFLWRTQEEAIIVQLNELYNRYVKN